MSLLSYSGITTKVRAMESRMLSDDQFRKMASLEDVRSAADFLKQQPAYQDFFSDLDDTRLHRGYLEQLLTRSQYRDFAKLYRFGNLAQRKFLDLYFLHYEITLIKQTLRRVSGNRQDVPDLSEFKDFFEKHSRVDLIALSQSSSLSEFVSRLEGTEYHRLFVLAGENSPRTTFDYELQLDLFYFKSLWNAKSKVLTRSEQKILDACFGSRLDLLNLQWIYRAKHYYRLPEADIYALLIPVRYKLRAPQLEKLVEASSPAEFSAAVQETVYGRLEESSLTKQPDVEALYSQILDRFYQTASQKHPYSIAILDSYLYFKEREVQRIITTIEGIRYGLNPEEIYRLAAKQ